MVTRQNEDANRSAPCELSLELVRAASAGDPHAFVPRSQEYVRRLDGGAARSSSFPWTQALEALATIQHERPDPAAAAWLGDALRAFLDPLGWIRDEERIQAAISAGRPVRLTLRLGAAELFALPWELVPLAATGIPLAGIPRCLIRYEWPGTTARPRPEAPDSGRVLFAWSAAGGYVPANEHFSAIQNAYLAARHAFDETGDAIAHTSLGRLQEALRASPVAVLHLLCHGARVDSSAEAYGLVLDSDDAQRGEVIDARALQLALNSHAGSLRLVVLCACHGGNPGALDGRLGSMAQALHRAGIPAVIGSRYPLSADASVAMADALYRRLLQDPSSVEEAFLDARERLLQRPQRMDWASLQLYARAPAVDDRGPGDDAMTRPTKETSPVALDLTTLPVTAQRLLARELLNKASTTVTREATWTFRVDAGDQPLVVCVRASVARDRGVVRSLEHTLEMMETLEDRIRFLEMQQMGPAGLAFDFGREARARRGELEKEAASLSGTLALLVHDVRHEG